MHRTTGIFEHNSGKLLISITYFTRVLDSISVGKVTRINDVMQCS